MRILITAFQFPSLTGPVCAKEVCAFQSGFASIPTFDHPDVEIVGISSGWSVWQRNLYCHFDLCLPDSHATLSAFAEKNKIAFPLLSDPKMDVQASYGVKPILFGKVRGRSSS